MSIGDTDHDLSEPGVEASSSEGRGLRLAFRGSLNSRSVHRVWGQALRHLQRARPAHLVVDAA
ncbi:MAG: hypothetical protein KDB80_02455, partial [Planctomycetes bacterium]|nr:hypothetical protein [Planctomycetota bacterium]